MMSPNRRVYSAKHEEPGLVSNAFERHNDRHCSDDGRDGFQIRKEPLHQPLK